MALIGLIDLNTSQETTQGPYQHHYTPGGALKGIVADDRSLQETWQSYMFNMSLVLLPGCL